jgi:hypothetical protein
MIRWLRRHKPVPSDAVDTLLNHLAKPDQTYAKLFIKLVGDRWEAFLNKRYLYQVAMTASCLAAYEGIDDRFGPILRRFEETVIFPRFHTGEWSQSSFAAAMTELAGLEKSTHSDTNGLVGLAWTRQWFADIGVQISNPADGVLFVTGWLQGIFYMRKLFVRIGKAY